MDELLKSALVGTATQPLARETMHPADAVFGTMDTDAERLLLLKAGVRAVWRQAGYVPRRDLPLLPPSPPDAASSWNELAVAALRAALTGEAKDLLPEFLERLAATGRTLPPELLPDALAPIARSNELRAMIRPVLGERGRWLARLNPDWSWAAGEQVTLADPAALATIWEEGTPGERVEALMRLRELDAADGRARLAAAFKIEKADVRLRLIDGMTVGLSMEDEPFLEEILSNRSEAVRAAAAGLLAHLPESRLVRRMVERADAMLAVERTGLLKRKHKLTAVPPSEIDKEWLRDSVPKDVPAGTGRGKRAVWLETVLGYVPLRHWAARFDMSPQDLILAARDDEFGDSTIRGWSRAAARSPSLASDDSVWSLALAEHWARQAGEATDARSDAKLLVEATDLLRQLLPHLRPADADRLVAALLDQSSRGDIHRVGTAVLTLLQGLPRPWSADLSRIYLTSARTAMADKQPRGYWWANTLPAAAAGIAPELLDEAQRVASELASDEASPYRGQLGRFIEATRLRRAFLQAIPNLS